MADQIPDGAPTWLTVAISVASTVACLKAWGPIGRWLGKRLDLWQERQAHDRGDLVAQLRAQLKATGDEMIELRLALARETEARVAFAIEKAALTERVAGLERALDEERRECRQAINELKREIRELRQQQRRDTTS